MELAPLGYFSKTHGVKGQLMLKLYSNVRLKKLKALFIELGADKVPYFIKEISESNKGLIVSLEDFESLEKSTKLVGKQVLVDSSILEKEKSEDDLSGFELIDKIHGSLGEILEINDHGAQLMMTLRLKEKEVLLPLVKELITRVDKKNRKLYYNAPEGLIEIYLQ